MLPRRLILLFFVPLLSSAANAADPQGLSQLLLEQRCEACDLRSADLVHADLLLRYCAEPSSSRPT